MDYYEKHGKMLPDNWKEKLGKHDAIFFGAVGMPDQVPDHISLWGSLLQFRREFDQYINLRPVKLFLDQYFHTFFHLQKNTLPQYFL